MGDVVPFRKKPRWTRPEDYGHFPDAPRPDPPRGGGRPPRPPRRTGWRAWLPLAFWLAVLGGLSLWVVADPAMIEPPSFLEGERETVAGPFSLCGARHSANCVIDGDTIMVGKRHIRLVGIDAPETVNARCDDERRRGDAAKGALLALLNQGPVTMVGRLDEPRDGYGRELKALIRKRPDGSELSIATELVRTGVVREYIGGGRSPWCPVTPG